MPLTSRLRTAVFFLLTVALLGLVAGSASSASSGGAARSTHVPRTISLQAGSTAFPQSQVSFSGKLSKSPKGTKVKLQQKRGTSWATLSTVGTNSKRGRYSAVATMPATTGVQEFRTLAPSAKVTKNGTTKKLKKATSAVVTVVVQTPPVPVPPIPPATPVIATSTLPDGEVGEVYAADLDLETPMSGTWAVAPTLPAGLALDATTGGLSGTPTSDGTSSLVFSFTPTAAGTVATKTLSLTVDPAPPVGPAITTTQLADGFAGDPYSQTLTTDDPGPGTWTLTTPQPGFSLDPTTGELSGSAATPGDYPFVVRFTRTADGLYDEDTLDLRLDAVPVATTPAVTIDAGGRQACRIKADSSLWCWGDHGKGAVGIGDVDLMNVRRPFPEHVGSALWLQVSAAVESVQSFTCGIQTDHSLWCWGSGSAGQLGLGADYSEHNAPVRVDDTRHWAQVSGGEAHACAITLGGKLFCWGNVATGLANGGANVPTEVDPGGAAWTSVSAGGSHTCGIRSTEALWCWGYNYRGQLGQGVGSPTTIDLPAQVGTANDWSGLSTGAAHTCGLRGTDLYCWGRNDKGAVGAGTPGTDVVSPDQVAGSWSTVSASGAGNSDHTCAVDTTGALWCWGDGGSGKLGNGTVDDQSVPVQVGSNLTWASVTTGGDFSCAVRANGSQYCWGGNSNGEVGVNSSAVEFLTPQNVSSCRGVVGAQPARC